MSEADLSALERVPFRVTNPRHIPVQRYYDEEFFRLECEHLWPHVWQMACRLEEIPEVGDWIEYTILEKSVIVVRTEEGVKAFHNACRHRGVKLASNHGNCAAQGFVCPFHGWRFNMHGENTFVFGRDRFAQEDVEAAEIALVPCRIELWGGCAFINFDDEAPGLIETLGPVTARMDARNVADLKVEWWRSAVLPVNWKTALEAFMEGYHVPATHPQLYAVSTPESNTYGPAFPTDKPRGSSSSGREYLDLSVRHFAKLSEGMGGMIHHTEVAIAESLIDMDVPEDPKAASGMLYMKLAEEITRQGQAQGLATPDLPAAMRNHPFKAVEFFFPNYFLLPFFSAMASYRVRPLTAETCLFEVWSLAMLPDDPDAEPPVAPVPEPYDSPSFPEITRQDFANLPLQQLGLHAKGFEFMRLQPETEGMISNYQRLVDGYLAGIATQRLAQASHVVNSGFEGPILDIGI